MIILTLLTLAFVTQTNCVHFPPRLPSNNPYRNNQISCDGSRYQVLAQGDPGKARKVIGSATDNNDDSGRENQRNRKEKKENQQAVNPWQDIDEISKIGKIYQQNPVSSVAQGPLLPPKINNKTKSGITSTNEMPKNQEQTVKIPDIQPPQPAIQIDEPTVNPKPKPTLYIKPLPKKEEKPVQQEECPSPPPPLPLPVKPISPQENNTIQTREIVQKPQQEYEQPKPQPKNNEVKPKVQNEGTPNRKISKQYTDAEPSPSPKISQKIMPPNEQKPSSERNFVPNVPFPPFQQTSVQATLGTNQDRNKAYYENANFEFSSLDSFEEAMSDLGYLPRSCYQKYYSRDD